MPTNPTDDAIERELEAMAFRLSCDGKHQSSALCMDAVAALRAARADTRRLEAIGRPTIIITSFDSGLWASFGDGNVRKFASIRELGDAAIAAEEG